MLALPFWLAAALAVGGLPSMAAPALAWGVLLLLWRAAALSRRPAGAAGRALPPVLAAVAVAALLLPLPLSLAALACALLIVGVLALRRGEAMDAAMDAAALPPLLLMTAAAV